MRATHSKDPGSAAQACGGPGALSAGDEKYAGSKTAEGVSTTTGLAQRSEDERYYDAEQRGDLDLVTGTAARREKIEN